MSETKNGEYKFGWQLPRFYPSYPMGITPYRDPCPEPEKIFCPPCAKELSVIAYKDAFLAAPEYVEHCLNCNATIFNAEAAQRRQARREADQKAEAEKLAWSANADRIGARIAETYGLKKVK